MHVTVKITASTGEDVTVLEEAVENGEELNALVEILKLAFGLETHLREFVEAKGGKGEAEAEG